MSRVYLLRHCDYENPLKILPGRLPLPLSENGRQRAEELQKEFADKQIFKIYSSAVLRCKETTEIVSDSKIPIVYDKRLLEVMSAYQGYWDENWHGTGFHFFSHRDELGGESFEDIRKRMGEFWENVRAKNEGNIIICSHGDPLQILYSYINNLPLASETSQETNIPGWIEKGEYLEIQI